MELDGNMDILGNGNKNGFDDGLNILESQPESTLLRFHHELSYDHHSKLHSPDEDPPGPLLN